MQTSKLAPLDTQAAGEVAEESPEGERSGSKSARRNEQRRRARQRKREGTEEGGAANTGLEVMSPSDLPLPKKPNERNLNRKSSRTKAGANPLPFSRNSSAPGKIETKTPIMNWKRSSYASRGQRLHEAVSFMVDLRELGPELAMKAPNGEQRCGMFLDLVEVMLNEELQFEGLKSPEIRSITRNGSVPEESLRGIEEDIDARFDQSLKSEALKDFILTSYAGVSKHHKQLHDKFSRAVQKATMLNLTVRRISGSPQPPLDRRVSSVSLLGFEEGHPSHNGLKALVPAMNGWDFNVFDVAKFCDTPLTFVGWTCLQEHGLLKTYDVDASNLKKFFAAIEEGYRANPYHNAIHAADVTRACHYFLTTAGLSAALQDGAPELSDVEIFAIILAAIVHDYKHPGVSHGYLVDAADDLAITYNDRSPLENMHLSEAFKLMRLPGHDILGNMEASERKQLRKLVIDMVLSTDMTVHFSHLSTLEAKLTSHDGQPIALDMAKPDDRSLVLETALHTADLNGPAAKWEHHNVWTDRVTEEFFQEGDKRKAGKLMLPPFMDREKPPPKPAFQMGFINAIVSPLYNAFARVPHLNVKMCTDQIAFNHAQWQGMITAASTAEGGAK